LDKQKLRILRSLFGNYRKVGEEFLFSCPFCKHHKPKLSVNLDKGAKCWVCGWATPNLYRLVRKFGNFEQRQEWKSFTNEIDINTFSEDLFGDLQEEPAPQTVDLPREFVSLANKNLPITSAMARSYLRSRGVTREDILRWKIGYCPSGEYKERVVVPSFNGDGYSNYFIARSYGREWPKYKNPPTARDIIFNELYIDWDQDLVIVEGVFDAIVAGPNAVPLLGSTIRESSKLFQEIVRHDTPIYVALDVDAEKKAMRLVRLLLQYDMEVYKVDISDHGATDVGEMSKEEFMQIKSGTPAINNDSYLLHKATAI